MSVKSTCSNLRTSMVRSLGVSKIYLFKLKDKYGKKLGVSKMYLFKLKDKYGKELGVSKMYLIKLKDKYGKELHKHRLTMTPRGRATITEYSLPITPRGIINKLHMYVQWAAHVLHTTGSLFTNEVSKMPYMTHQVPYMLLTQ